MDPDSTLTPGCGPKRSRAPEIEITGPPMTAAERKQMLDDAMAPDSSPPFFSWQNRGPGLCLADFKGCGTMLALCAGALIIGGCLKQRSDAREIVALQTLINNVQTLLKKGKVRQAMELLEEREREMDWQALREDARD
jgi:hypothetical protein